MCAAATHSLSAQAQGGQADPALAGAAHPRILLVDDDPVTLGILSRMLRNMGLGTAKVADRAEDALLTLQREPDSIDIIICDLNMPGMDGIEFLQALSAGHFRGHVILLSGEGGRIMHAVQKLLSGGPVGVLGALQKPAGRPAIQAMLDCWRAPSASTAPRVPPPVSAEDIALAVRDQAWLLHYQPKVDVRSGALVGVEALVRWPHPAHGLLYPDAFIGIAESTGAIDALTDWVIGEAVRQLSRWQQAGLHLKMSVNVSMRNLSDPGFAQRVSDIARAAGVSPRDLVLEVTESQLMGSTSAPLQNLVRLRLQRFALSIDDFGTGHSSLSQLRDVPFTELKVDRGFVQGARNNQIIRPILEGSIGIAKRLEMHSVAEGVETDDDWQLLREIGCDFAQGWFVGRPMPAEKMHDWLHSWAGRCPELITP
jgi:EAL domain-containing protein (putative c-di-GMP-specific phosphodiesterase class I)/CheY-like chemotaxis protein